MGALPQLSRTRVEPFAPRVQTNQPTFNKQQLAYERSLERILAAGHERHLRPAEAFGIIIAHLEGRPADPESAAAAKDMVVLGTGEWLSVAAQYDRAKAQITYFLDPQGLEYTYDNIYNPKNLTFSEQRTFKIPQGIFKRDDLATTMAEIPASLLLEEHVRFLYGRRYQELPAQMKSGFKLATIQLPPAGIWPISRGGVSSGERCLVSMPAGHDLVYSTTCKIESSQQLRGSRGYTPDAPRKGPGTELGDAQEAHQAG